MGAASPPEAFASQQHPLEEAGAASRWLLIWLWPLLRLGQRRPLSDQDVWPVPRPAQGARVAARLWRCWSAPAGAKRRSLPRALSLAWARALAWAALAGAAGTLLMELPPLLMGQVLECLLREGDELRGWAFVAASSACIACTGLVIACVHRLHSALGVEVRSALACAVYHQVLRLGGGTCARIGSHALSSFCSTLVSVDCERAYILCHYGLFLWIDFLMVTACLLLLVLVLGPAGLGGCAVLVGGTLVQRVFMGWLVSARRDMQAASDRRLAATQELLENIRSIKMMGLEGVLSERICGERGVELARQRRVLLLRALNGSFTYCLVHLSLLAVLVVARQGQQQVTLPGLFAALALLNANRVVFMVIPFELAALSEGLASLGRVQGFLREERSTGGGAGPEDAARPPPTDATAEPEPARLQVADGVFAWASGGAQGRPGRDELRAPGLEVRPGELAVVVGTSGGGKSSLCSALLGWMPRVSGELEGGAAGPVAFCPQEPWVLSGTVRENVLGHAGGDEERLWQALRLAALEEEVRALPGGADCEIGFRGLNLSGGQKARLALARALALQGARAYVLDDALSSLDQATAEALVEGTVLGHLAGRTRVAVLNSHYEALLPHAQVIVLVEQGVATAFRRKEEFEATEFAQLLAAGRTERAEHEGEPEGASPSWIARGLPAGVGAEELAAGPPPGGAAPEARAGEVASRLYEAEVRKRGPLHPSVYRDYFGLGGRGGGAATSAALLVLVMVALALPDLVRVFAELYLAQVLEEQGATVDGTALLRFSLMVALTFLLALARALVFTALARRSSRRVHSRLLEGLCRAPIHTFFDVMPPGRLLNFFGKDLDAVDTLLPYQALEFLQDVAVLGTALLVCVVVFPMVLLAILPCAFLLLRVRQLYVCSSRELMRMEATSRSPMLTMVTETISGLPVVRAHCSEADMYKQFCGLVDQNAAFFMHVWILMPWLALNIEQMVAAVFLVACVSALLLKSVVGPALTAVALTNIMSLLSKAQITCRQSVEVEKLFTAVERLSHLLGSMPAEQEVRQGAEPRHSPDVVGKGGARLERPGRPGAGGSEAELPEASWPGAGHVRFEDASLRYRPGLPLVLEGLCLEVLPGRSVGLIGASGCGKSSCLRAILRLAELERGRICIDGVDIAAVPLSVLRERVASVPQEPLVLSGTLRRNLLPRRGRPDEEAQCWAMLDTLGLGAAVRAWPKGLDTELAAGDEGLLSLGQRQLLGLGRSLLRGATVLCVDEATAHVDGPTDAALQRALLDGPARQRATRLTVAHRLWTLRHCDEVLLLRPGSPTQVHRIENPGAECLVSGK